MKLHQESSYSKIYFLKSQKKNSASLKKIELKIRTLGRSIKGRPKVFKLAVYNVKGKATSLSLTIYFLL